MKDYTVVIDKANLINENFSAVLRTPNNIILTRINNIMIRFIIAKASGFLAVFW